MQDHATDDGVFIRSMATRGHVGGLALAVPDAVRVLAAAGWPWIIVETVGVGQVEVEVAGRADTCVVVVNPGWGDAVQASKAGLMEIADVFVINKADRDGVGADPSRPARCRSSTVRPTGGRRSSMPSPPTAVASPSCGAAVAEHRVGIEASGELARRRAARRVAELHSLVARRLELLARAAAGDDAWRAAEDHVAAGELTPAAAADQLLAVLRAGGVAQA